MPYSIPCFDAWYYYLPSLLSPIPESHPRVLSLLNSPYLIPHTLFFSFLDIFHALIQIGMLSKMTRAISTGINLYCFKQTEMYNYSRVEKQKEF